MLSLPFRPELKRLTIGYMSLLDSSPLIWASHQRYFAAVGLEVDLVREVSWASLRDRLAYGALDAAQCLAPMPLAATLGADGVGVPIVTALCLSHGGSAITFSRSIAERIGLSSDNGPLGNAAAVRQFLRRGQRLRLAHVFAFSMHHYLLRDWLAQAGIEDDETGIEYRVAPPSQMVRLMESGTVDGFCVGEPWNTAAAQGRLGIVVASTSAIRNHSADKVLGVTREWAHAHPKTHRALVAALMLALHDLGTRQVSHELARLLVARSVLPVPQAWIETALCSPQAVSPPQFHSGADSFPRRSQMIWCALQMLRWRQWNRPLSIEVLSAEVCDREVFQDAAAAVSHHCGFNGEPVHSRVVPLRGRGTASELRPLSCDFELDDPAEYLVARGWPINAARAALTSQASA